MTAPARILIADDDASIRLVLSQSLSQEGFQPRATSNASTLWRWVKDGEGDLVITDVVMPDENIFDMLPRMREARPKLPIIVMSAQSNLLTAVKAAQLGAFEYLPKPFDLEEVAAAVRRALAPSRAKEADQAARRAEKDEKLPLVGRSAPMQELYRTLSRVVDADLTVMIQGEPGSGKSLVARTIHSLGRRRTRPFVVANLSAMTPEESSHALFGFRATEGFSLLQEARGGTLYLDEVGDLSVDAQSKLLRALDFMEQTQEDDPARATPRIIASSAKNLRQLVDGGKFREDLFYRLNVLPVRIPALRERAEDIPELARALLVRAKRDGLPERLIEANALEALKGYHWPGNVRELENVLRRIAALQTEPVVRLQHIERELRTERVEAAVHTEEGSYEEMVRRQLAASVAQAIESGRTDLHDSVMSGYERPLIELCLQATRGNQIKAAEILGLNRNTLRKRIRTLGVTSRTK